MPKAPTPRDEITRIAGRVLARERKMMVATAGSYNELLADASKLAGFVLRADRTKGSNQRG
jgi:hypothetical protein